jgi:predicted nucleotidyltransferase
MEVDAEGPSMESVMANTTNLQQHEALALGMRCVHVLQHRFGARRVIPFGSVVGHGTWHSGSDLDLAVEGIAPEQFFRAWAAVRALVPPGVEVDLVDLEHASEALRARILEEKTTAEDPIRTLKALVEDELAALGAIVQAVQEGLDRSQEPPSQFVMQALASYLHQFYTGCERILVFGQQYCTRRSGCAGKTIWRSGISFAMPMATH